MGPTGVVAIGLYELNVAARTGMGEFDKHATTVSKLSLHVSLVPTRINVPLQENRNCVAVDSIG